MTDGGDERGCFPGCGGHGCAALVFVVLLLAVLMVEHALHIFEGALWIVAGLLGLGVVLTGAWWVAKWVLIRIARRIPDESEAGVQEKS